MKSLEKFFCFSVGFAAQSNEKLTKLVQKLIEQGKISTAEAKKHLDEYAENLENLIETFDCKLEDFITQTLNNLTFAKEDDLDEIKERIEKIEAHLNKD